MGSEYRGIEWRMASGDRRQGRGRARTAAKSDIRSQKLEVRSWVSEARHEGMRVHPHSLRPPLPNPEFCFPVSAL